MKKNLFKLSWLLIAAFVSFTACNNDDDDNGGDNPILVEDGIYVKGAGTALADLDAKGMMKVTRNEVLQEERADLLEIYIAVKGGTDGFNIVEVAGSTQTVYGPGTDYVVVGEADRDGDEPKVDFWRGSYTESADKFTVTADGLYHVMIDKELKKVAVVPVVWGVIGAATPGGWSNSTALSTYTFDLNTITFAGTEIELTKADYKFRYSDGWKVILDTEYDLGNGSKGIKVNTNFGGAVDALVPGGANIANAEGGVYTIEMKWTLGGAYAATVTKTGESTIKDYTNTELGLVGDGIIVADTANGWNFTTGLSKPVVSNTTYTWSWEGVEVSAAGSFKFREGQTWDNMSIGYPQVTVEGGAASNFGTNNDGNFVPVADGVFDITLKIEAATETYTVTIEAAGTPDPEMYMLGDGCTAGWDNTKALPMTGTNGEYTIITTLTAGKYIKFITTLGQWAPMYGTDANGTSTGGNLVFRETEAVADPASIPTPATDGTYTVSINTNTLTYTITAK
ncbi:MAG: SusF/SusE family outer membrane protein [Salinivirgaceae bacterium]|nr:SusF/SusE family outer membrane protein [Salinivirgaceae bacterium]